VEEANRLGVSAVLAADTEPKVGPDATARCTAMLTSSPTPASSIV
jgi:hypothetical protein